MRKRQLIKFAESKDIKSVYRIDPQLKKLKSVAVKKIKEKVRDKEIIIARVDNEVVGVLRLAYLWLSLPYIEMIYILENFRKQGLGKKMLKFLENHLKESGYQYLLTSSQEDEKEPQQWHKKMGFEKCGALAKINLPGSQAREVFFIKKIT